MADNWYPEWMSQQEAVALGLIDPPEMPAPRPDAPHYTSLLEPDIFYGPFSNVAIGSSADDMAWNRMDQARGLGLFGQEFTDYVLAPYGDIEYFDQDGYTMGRHPDLNNGEPFRADQSGLDALGSSLYTAGYFTPGAGAIKGGSWLAQLARAGAYGGLTQTGIETAQGAAGADFDWEQIPLAAAGEMAFAAPFLQPSRRSVTGFHGTREAQPLEHLDDSLIVGSPRGHYFSPWREYSEEFTRVPRPGRFAENPEGGAVGEYRLNYENPLDINLSGRRSVNTEPYEEKLIATAEALGVDPEALIRLSREDPSFQQMLYNDFNPYMDNTLEQGLNREIFEDLFPLDSHVSDYDFRHMRMNDYDYREYLIDSVARDPETLTQSQRQTRRRHAQMLRGERGIPVQFPEEYAIRTGDQATLLADRGTPRRFWQDLTGYGTWGLFDPPTGATGPARPRPGAPDPGYPDGIPPMDPLDPQDVNWYRDNVVPFHRRGANDNVPGGQREEDVLDDVQRQWDDMARGSNDNADYTVVETDEGRFVDFSADIERTMREFLNHRTDPLETARNIMGSMNVPDEALYPMARDMELDRALMELEEYGIRPSAELEMASRAMQGPVTAEGVRRVDLARNMRELIYKAYDDANLTRPDFSGAWWDEAE